MKTGVECEFFLLESGGDIQIADSKDVAGKPCYDQVCCNYSLPCLRCFSETMIHGYLVFMEFTILHMRYKLKVELDRLHTLLQNVGFLSANPLNGTCPMWLSKAISMFCGWNSTLNTHGPLSTSVGVLKNPTYFSTETSRRDLAL